MTLEDGYYWLYDRNSYGWEPVRIENNLIYFTGHSDREVVGYYKHYKFIKLTIPDIPKELE
jgi:hypothetical protein